LSTGIAAIVVQFRVRDDSFRDLASACGLTSESTSGTSGSMRHAEELSITTAPRRQTTGASLREVAPTGREEHDVDRE
jgi:hypothetical protein